MQPAYISLNASDIVARQFDSENIQKKIDEFLARGEKIQVFKTRTHTLPERSRQFSRGIANTPSRRAAVAEQEEDISLAVRELSEVIIMGIAVRRTASDIAVILKQRGYKLEASSVERVAKKIGVTLKNSK